MWRPALLAGAAIARSGRQATVRATQGLAARAGIGSALPDTRALVDRPIAPLAGAARGFAGGQPFASGKKKGVRTTTLLERS